MDHIMRFKTIILTVFISIGLISCDALIDFGDINTDPNRVKTTTPDSFLAPVIYQSTWDNMQYGHRLANEFVQYSVHNSEINEFHRYVVPHPESNNIWSRFYRNLTDIVDMHRTAEEIGNDNYLAIAKIFKSWAFANLTDIFGPIPYHDALMGDQGGSLQPSFDTQEEVYRNILAELEEANTLFDFEREINAQNDILFHGDLSRWQKLANSLRLRLLLRVSERPEMNSSQQIAEILNNPGQYPIFTSNEDAAILYYSGTRPNINPFSDWRPLEFNGNRRATEYMINKLNDLNDPRLYRTMMPNDNGEWVGIPGGWADDPPSPTSTYNDELAATDQPAIILSYAEIEFIKAEASLKGWVDGNPAEHYANGIESSMEFWGDPVPDGYLDQPDVEFDGQMSTLMSQKWIALFWSGMEGWHEYRRTGYPELPIGPGTSNNGIVPTRLRFPSTVQALNQANYQTAVQLLGGEDNLRTKLWWQP
jgi:hypothetical protein